MFYSSSVVGLSFANAALARETNLRWLEIKRAIDPFFLCEGGPGIMKDELHGIEICVAPTAWAVTLALRPAFPWHRDLPTILLSVLGDLTSRRRKTLPRLPSGSWR